MSSREQFIMGLHAIHQRGLRYRPGYGPEADNRPWENNHTVISDNNQLFVVNLSHVMECHCSVEKEDLLPVYRYPPQDLEYGEIRSAYEGLDFRIPSEYNADPEISV